MQDRAFRPTNVNRGFLYTYSFDWIACDFFLFGSLTVAVITFYNDIICELYQHSISEF